MSKIIKLTKKHGGAKSHNVCKSNKVSSVMKEFEKKKLKDRAGKTIKNRKQAIAIALNQSQSVCKYNKSDVEKLLNKVNKDLNNKNKLLNLTDIIETKDAIEELSKMNKKKDITIIKKLLLDKIINEHINGQTLDHNMWSEIKKIEL